MVCRRLMLFLDRAGHIELPASRAQMINSAILHRRVREVAVVDQIPIEGSLASLGPVALSAWSAVAKARTSSLIF